MAVNWAGMLPGSVHLFWSHQPAKWLEWWPRMLIQLGLGFPGCLFSMDQQRKVHPWSTSGLLPRYGCLDGPHCEASPNCLCDYAFNILVPLFYLCYLAKAFHLFLSTWELASFLNYKIKTIHPDLAANIVSYCSKPLFVCSCCKCLLLHLWAPRLSLLLTLYM